MFKPRIIISVLLLFLLGPGMTPALWAGPSPEIPVKGMVSLVDLGANSCIPCRMMAPVLEKLEKNYRGRAAIIFIDVWKNPSEAERFKFRVIPTQIFFDKNGREAYRHEGFMSEKDIVAVLKKLGVD